MKKMFSVMLLVVSLLAACNNPKSDEPQKKGSSGKTLELMIVADKDVYRGETKELIDSLFARPQIGLPVPEKMFDIVNIPVSSYKNTEMFRNHRNIIYCDVNPNNPDKVYSREMLLEIIWKDDYQGDARTVDVHVRRLREKIEENPGSPKYVHTKWGVGYYFHVDE